MTFLLALAPPPPWYTCGNLEGGSLYSQCVTLILDSRSTELVLKKSYLYLSVLVWTMVPWRTDAKNLPALLFVCLFLLLFLFCFCLIQNSLRKVSAGKAVAFLKHNLRQRNIQQLLKAKDYNCGKEQNDEILGGKLERDFLWKVRPLRSACTDLGIYKATHVFWAGWTFRTAWSFPFGLSLGSQQTGSEG